MKRNIDIKTLIEGTLEDRVINIVDELADNRTYLELEESEESLFNILYDGNPQLRCIIEEIERIQLEKNTCQLVHVYKRGLLEGAKVLEVLGYLDLDFADANE